MTAPISQQASAVETAARIISGAAQKPSRKEQEFLHLKLEEASITLRWLERNEAKIRAVVGA